LIAERKVIRKNKRVEREEEAKRKKELWAETLELRRLRRELKAKSIELKKSQKKKPKEMEAQESSEIVINRGLEVGGGQIRPTRSGRQPKASKRFNN